MVMDVTKDFTNILVMPAASYEKKTTEPYFPWNKAAEKEIKELKKGYFRKIFLTNMHHRLWDDCLECKAYIYLYTAQDIFKLKGDVPKTVMSDKSLH